MATTTPDALVQAVYDLLDQSATKPAGLTLLDHDMLPVDQDELPVVGVYLVEDNPESAFDTYDSGSQRRIATIRVEIRVQVEPEQRATEGHRAFREWIALTLMTDETLGGLAAQVARGGYTPFMVPADIRIAGADLDFEAVYLSRPIP